MTPDGETCPVSSSARCRKYEVNILNNYSQQKKQETLMLIILALVLAVIVLFSKFVIGVNFSLMEQGGYLSIGYHEVNGDQFWSLEFESFTGSISHEGKLPPDAGRRLMIHSHTGNSELMLKVDCGGESAEYQLGGTALNIPIPGNKDKFKLTLSGIDVYTGYFNAVWE